MTKQSLTYKDIIRKLEKEGVLLLSFPSSSSQDKEQRRLSQAKVRLGVEGKLSFEWTKRTECWDLSIVLLPPKTVALGVIIKEAGV